MTRLPKVTALVPAWRSAEFIQGPLASLAAQTYPNLDILISDDASPDDTAEVCAAFVARTPNARLIRQPVNLGWVENINALLREAEGDYFFVCCHDDEPRPTFVERLVKTLEARPGAVLAAADMEVHYADGRVIVRGYDEIDGTTGQFEQLRVVARRDGYWWTGMHGMFRASAARQVGGMRQHLAGDFGSDWLWLLELSLLGEFEHVREPLIVKHYLQQGLTLTWRHSVWQRSALLLGGMQVLHGAGLPLSKELPLQAGAVTATLARWGRELRGLPPTNM